MQLPCGDNRWRCEILLRFQWDRLQWLELWWLLLWLLGTVVVTLLVYHLVVIVRWICAWLYPFVVYSFFGCHTFLGIPSMNEINLLPFVIWNCTKIFFGKNKLTLSTCWQSQRKVDHCNVTLGPMAWCLAFVCDSLSWWCSVDYHVNRRIDDDVMPDLIHPPAVHSIPPLCKPAAQLHFHQEISGSRCIAQLIYILWIFKIGVR